jgi:selenide,water dikinase
MEDAGIYKLSDELALVQTVDFFTPIVDDPYDFGQIAVANALSDVYAKGGKPLLAMNIVCFPVDKMDISILRAILQGGLDKLKEADTLLVKGHSVDDPELKYGLAVTGTIHPDNVVLNNTVKVGDQLILTKPLGTGIISTAIKKGLAEKHTIDKIVKSMTTLNRKASELMVETGVSACTDVSGFGLMGHACEMVEDTNHGLVINASAVPIFVEAKSFAEMGMIPGGLNRNRDYREPMVDISPSVPGYLADILFDPQTSGGLLISVSRDKVAGLLKNLHRAGIAEAAIIGEVVAKPKQKIAVI